jgi:hypothetical protein
LPWKWREEEAGRSEIPAMIVQDEDVKIGAEHYAAYFQYSAVFLYSVEGP